MEEFNSEVKQAPLSIDYELTVLKGKEILLLDPQDGVTLDRSPDLAPAKLTFKVFKDKLLDIQEGDLVNFKVNGELVFVGYIFEKRRNKDNFINVTAYDQCRYLSSEAYYIFNNEKSASELIVALSADVGIKLGTVTPTQPKISYVFDGTTYRDIFLTILTLTSGQSPKIPIKSTPTLDPSRYRGGFSGLNNVSMSGEKKDPTERLNSWGNETSAQLREANKKDTDSDIVAPNGKYFEKNDIQYLMDNKYTKEQAIAELSKTDKYKKKEEKPKLRRPLYIAYDDNGELTVKEINDMVTDILIDSTQVGDYDYISSIDKNTFTQILVVREANVNDGGVEKKQHWRTGAAYAKEQSRKWGILQKVFKPKEKDINAIDMAKKDLELLAKKTHSLRLSDCLGHTEIRPGSGVWLNFDIGDQIINELVYVESVTHKFNNHKHLMDLDIIYFDKEVPEITTEDWGDEAARKRIEELKKSKSKGSSKGGTTTGAGATSSAAVQKGLDAVLNTSSPYGDNGCVDRATLAGSYYNSMCKGAYEAGIKDVPGLKSYAEANGYAIEEYTGQANPGDILIYDGEEHVVVADGNGGCVGNSTDAGQVIQYSDVNYAYHNGVPPTHIIRTGVR